MAMARPGLVAATALALIALSVYFFVNAVSLLAENPPRAAAGILAALIGFALLSSATSLLKAYVASRAG